MSKIYENIYLGSNIPSSDKEFFKKNNIKNVLIVAKN